MASRRQLVVVADDFGIGPETDRGILELGQAGIVGGTVLLVNSPHAEAAVSSWNRAGRPVELGWHPALTLDQPVLDPERVPSLVDESGRFHTLGRFLLRSMLGQIRASEVFLELAAQYERFMALVGQPPRLVNSHQHVSLFRPVRAALLELLTMYPERPFVRRVREPWRTLARIPGARIKRAMLSHWGRQQGRAVALESFPACDWLAGITDPLCVADPLFFQRWLSLLPGRAVELMCHPGHRDPTLIGRDCRDGDEDSLQRRVREWDLLRSPGFLEAARQAGWELTSPSRLKEQSAAVAA